MGKEIFKAIVVSEQDGSYVQRIQDRCIDDLPEGDLLVNVKYSSLNYKDALSATGHKGVTRHYPHTPGIDAAGVVETSACGDFSVGDEVIVHGYDLGMNTSGGFAEYIRVPFDWALKLPSGLSLRESMIIGTAGFTAAHCIDKLEHAGLSTKDGPVLVTGASGGVGSMAVAILSGLGYEVTAASGKSEKKDYLQMLGASSVISREQVMGMSGWSLLGEQWAGAVDTVGGQILASVIKSLKYGGSVAACGLAMSHELNTTVYPFILRGVSLLGVDSVMCAMKKRKHLWEMLANQWKPAMLESVASDCRLEELEGYVELMLKGKVAGRVVVSI